MCRIACVFTAMDGRCSAAFACGASARHGGQQAASAAAAMMVFNSRDLSAASHLRRPGRAPPGGLDLLAREELTRPLGGAVGTLIEAAIRAAAALGGSARVLCILDVLHRSCLGGGGLEERSGGGIGTPRA